MTVKTAPYGTWTSPITAEHAAAAGGGPAWVRLVGGSVWWTEGRPADDGRVAIVCRAPGGDPVDVLPPGWNARNRVHEYGGFPFVVTGDGDVVFTNWDDQRLYRCAIGGTPTPLTPEPRRPQGVRYAELVLAGSEVWCVRETATGDAPTDISRALVAVPIGQPGEPRVLGASHHFMSAPRPSPDGRHAAWIGWDHPAMPWDGTVLCVAEVRDGVFGEPRVLAGGPDQAVCQFEWEGPDSLLALVDPDGWWNLHRVGLDGSAHNLTPVAEEIGGAVWRLGTSWFAPLGGGRHAVLRNGRLAVLDERTGLVDVPTDHDWWASMLVAEDGRIACTAGGPRRELAVVTADLSTVDTTGDIVPVVEVVEVSHQPDDLPVATLLPRPAELWFATADGAQVPAYVYPPTNPAHQAPDGERPPYIVHVHGGPTSRNAPVLDMEIAFFTSRGFGVVAPNYGGSTGYGRVFRERLREQWGVIDVADCAAVAQALAAAGTADPGRLIVRGGSAGGWTTAASLAADGSIYRCGTAMYPILDLSGWTAEGAETHDFESQYLHSLVGPLPQTRDRYVDRSPTSHPERIAGPILLLQGMEDEICPPAQAQRLVTALAGSGIAHAYLTFDGEQHGFRKASTIAAALNAELAFYGQVLGFEPPGVPRLELSS